MVIKNIDIELEPKELMLLNKYNPDVDEDLVHLWNYFEIFSKTNDICEKMTKGLSSQASSILCQNAPTVRTDEKNKKQIMKLEDLIDKFTELVDESGKSKNTICRILLYFVFCCNFACCRCSRFFQRGPCKQKNQANGLLFGDLYQSKLIMEKNFEGKQFMIPSVRKRNQPEIDCMFFPATHGDKIVIDPDQLNLEDPKNLIDKKYLEKSTIIMSNPNALIY